MSDQADRDVDGTTLRAAETIAMTTEGGMLGELSGIIIVNSKFLQTVEQYPSTILGCIYDTLNTS